MKKDVNITVEQGDGYRVYVINGDRYPSATTVLGERTREYMKGRPELSGAVKVGGDYGDLFHDYSLMMDNGKPLDELGVDDPELFVSLCAWDAWVKRYIRKWVLIEVVVWSKSLRVAGRLDRVGYFGNETEPCIIDIKTGRPGGYDQKQQWIYKTALAESRGMHVGRCLLAHVNRRNPGTIAIRECNAKREMADMVEIKQTIQDFYNARGGKV